MSKLWKGVKKVFKKVGRFVKKYWKEIVLVAAVVFTAGVATVGWSGLSSTFTSLTQAGMSSFAAGLKVAGSTMWAGVTSIAGSLGLGSGAKGLVAANAGMQGATLGTGSWAAKLGSNVAKVNVASAGTNSALQGGSGLAASAGGQVAATPMLADPGMLKAAEGIKAANAAQNATQPLLGSTGTGSELVGGTNLVSAAAEQTAKKGLMDTMAGHALVQGGIGMAQGYMQGRAMEEREPKAFWGVNLDGSPAHNVLPGMINPDTGQPYTEDEAAQINANFGATAGAYA